MRMLQHVSYGILCVVFAWVCLKVAYVQLHAGVLSLNFHYFLLDQISEILYLHYCIFTLNIKWI